MASALPAPPVLNPSNETTPPALPAKWHAVALLTPFAAGGLVVADVWYDWSVQAMRVTLYGVNGGYLDVLYTPNGAYLLSAPLPGGDPQQCFGPIPTATKVPPPSFLTTLGLKCRGLQTVLGTNCSWWVGTCTCSNGSSPQDPPAPTDQVANWFWLRSDNQLPWRMMVINEDNPYLLPVLGACPVVHFPSFQAVSQTSLPAIIQACTSRGPVADSGAKVDSWSDITTQMASGASRLTQASPDALRTTAQSLIPGIRPALPTDPLPVWPDRFYLTSFSIATFEVESGEPNVPYPTRVYFDSTSQNMLTRMLTPNGAFEDCILDSSSTHVVMRLPNGAHKCGPSLPVGLPYTNWAARDGGQVMAAIANNPNLSPGVTTLLIAMPSDQGRVFWAWYTTTGTPVMFLEVPQLCNVQLVLTDYYAFVPNPPPFDPSLFVVPSDCLQGA